MEEDRALSSAGSRGPFGVTGGAGRKTATTRVTAWFCLDGRGALRVHGDPLGFPRSWLKAWRSNRITLGEVIRFGSELMVNSQGVLCALRVFTVGYFFGTPMDWRRANWNTVSHAASKVPKKEG